MHPESSLLQEHNPLPPSRACVQTPITPSRCMLWQAEGTAQPPAHQSSSHTGLQVEVSTHAQQDIYNYYSVWPLASHKFLVTVLFFTPFSGVSSPSDLDVSDIQDNALTVRWSSARGPITGYRVTGTPKGGQGPTFSELVGPGETSLAHYLFITFYYYS